MKIFNWLSENQLKANPEKCNLIFNTKEKYSLTVDETLITSTEVVKLLGVQIDNRLTFKTHIETICKKANQKISALARAAPYMNLQKKRLLMNAFFDSQFNYSPLVWMCHSRELNNKINRVHERCLHLIYNDKISTFQELLDKDRSITIHQRNLQRLAIEMFKAVKGISLKCFQISLR